MFIEGNVKGMRGVSKYLSRVSEGFTEFETPVETLQNSFETCRALQKNLEPPETSDNYFETGDTSGRGSDVFIVGNVTGMIGVSK